MQLLNTSERYGAVSQTLHWMTAALVVVLIVSGKAGDIEAEEGNELHFWHSSLGLLVLLLVIARIVWRFVTPPPKQPATASRLAGRMATALHLLFYAFLVALPLSGWLASSAEGGTVSFFGVATLPQWSAPRPSSANVAVDEEGERIASSSAAREDQEGGEDFFEEAHEVLGNALLILVILHALAALKHHFMDKDDVLLRMLPASRKPIGSSGDRGSHAPQGSA
jgi:cytochrome b561